MSRWVLTGGVGFIGYHVADALANRGDEVVVLDPFGAGLTPQEHNERNLRDLSRAHGSIPLVKASILDRDAIAPAFGGADGVIHLAGISGTRMSVGDPALYARVNVEGTAHVIEASLAAGVRRIVMMSSSSVYGDSTSLPAREDAIAIAPTSPYAASKRGAELMASAIVASRPELCVACLRPFSVYGPRQRPDTAIVQFVQAALHDHPITMHGDGSQARDFTHVSDIVRGVLAAADRVRPGFRVYNLGAGAPVSLVDLVRIVARVVGREPTVAQVPEPPGNVDKTHADITRAQQELDWSPRVALHDGIATVRDWLTRR